MQKWTSLLALAMLVGCAATPPALPPTAMQVEAVAPAAEPLHVQQVFITPTPAPSGIANPLEVSKANRLLDLAVLDLNASLKAMRVRLTRERDRNLLNFGKPDPYSTIVLNPLVLTRYENGMNATLTQTENNFTLAMNDLLDARNQDLATVKAAIVKAKTAWNRIRMDAERLMLFHRQDLSARYADVQKARRRARG